MPRNCFHILSVPCRCQHLFDIILKHLLASFIVMPRTTSELETSLTSKSSTARTLIHHFFISNSLKHGAIRIPRSHLSPNPNMARKRVAEDPTTGRRTLLQRHQPGSLDSRESLHDYIEEIFIVEGDLGDKRTGQTYRKGYYAYRKLGIVHGPFFSKTGCLMFITCTPVRQGENA
jgi:hypothetical protein